MQAVGQSGYMPDKRTAVALRAQRFSETSNLSEERHG